MQKQWPTLTGALSAYLDDFITSGDTYISSIAGENWRHLGVTALTDLQIEAWYYEYSAYLDSDDLGRLSSIIDEGNKLLSYFDGYPETGAVMQRIKDFIQEVLVFRDFFQDVDYRFNICTL